MGKQGCIK